MPAEFRSSKAVSYIVYEPLLTIFDREKPIFIYTDTSGVGIEAVLKQKQSNGIEKPVTHFSQKYLRASVRKKQFISQILPYRKLYIIGSIGFLVIILR